MLLWDATLKTNTFFFFFINLATNSIILDPKFLCATFSPSCTKGKQGVQG